MGSSTRIPSMKMRARKRSIVVRKPTISGKPPVLWNQFHTGSCRRMASKKAGMAPSLFPSPTGSMLNEFHQIRWEIPATMKRLIPLPIPHF